ncbi:MAG: hypothetical protein EOO65_00180 [Methanosarcinales archaeon]|nr:MAG: hypothetical protein EOO65_00180 [Methanosarcinales archaeon]
MRLCPDNVASGRSVAEDVSSTSMSLSSTVGGAGASTAAAAATNVVALDDVAVVAAGCSSCNAEAAGKLRGGYGPPMPAPVAGAVRRRAARNLGLAHEGDLPRREKPALTVIRGLDGRSLEQVWVPSAAVAEALESAQPYMVRWLRDVGRAALPGQIAWRLGLDVPRTPEQALTQAVACAARQASAEHQALSRTICEEEAKRLDTRIVRANRRSREIRENAGALLRQETPDAETAVQVTTALLRLSVAMSQAVQQSGPGG